MLPYNRDDPNEVFTLEYRIAVGVDKGVRLVKSITPNIHLQASATAV
jgi:hypothetical protein